MTSSLPRKCSTTELQQRGCKDCGTPATGSPAGKHGTGTEGRRSGQETAERPKSSLRAIEGARRPKHRGKRQPKASADPVTERSAAGTTRAVSPPPRSRPIRGQNASPKRAKGIEPSPPAWKAGALPLSYARERAADATQPAAENRPHGLNHSFENTSLLLKAHVLSERRESHERSRSHKRSESHSGGERYATLREPAMGQHDR